MKTHVTKEADITRKWYVVDAEGKHLGRLASEVAKVLRGKNKPEFAPNVDTGDFVIIVNAEKVVLTGKKLEQKVYRRHTGHPGGLKETVYKIFMKEHPERAVEKAVKGMLPHNHLGKEMAKKLKIYTGPEHKHQAQMLEKLELDI